MAMEGNLEMGQEFFMEIWNGYERSKELEEENKTLKDNVEFLHQCLDDRDKSIQYAEEENKKLNEELEKWKYGNSLAFDDIERICNEKLQLEEENKSLKNNLEVVRMHRDGLEEENKKLNIKVASLEGEIKGLNSVIDKLKEENQTLELWLDNKEKVNKSLREENEKLRIDREFEKGNTIFPM